MNGEAAAPGFLSLSELLKFLEYGMTGLVAILAIIPAFLIFTLIFRKTVKRETVQLIKMLFAFTGGLVVLLFFFTYFANNTVVTRASGDIDKTQDRIDTLTREIEDLKVSNASADMVARLENAKGALTIKLNELQRLTGTSGGYDLLMDERPYKGMETSERLIAIAKSRLGTKWAFGKRAQLANKDFQGPWDNSEFMGWVVFQATGEVIGCEPPDPGLADCYTGFWGGEPGDAGEEKSVAWGLAYHGGILVRLPAPAANRAGKVGISLGDGTFIEANGDNGVVQVSEPRPADYWDFAVQLY
ncbi:MAG: C40 family peptidase [Rhodobiaceae bacterium]|nr:C40 family peptidase [Rhodobiaceae bacterium]